jgi:hypothetical protein
VMIGLSWLGTSQLKAPKTDKVVACQSQSKK